MDPVSLGVAAVALLGSKAVEEFATQAGSTAWEAVQRMGESVRSRLSPRGARALDQLTHGEAGALVARDEVRAVAGDGVRAAAPGGDMRALAASDEGRAPHGRVRAAAAGDGVRAGSTGGDGCGVVAGDEACAVVAAEIADAVRADPGFRAELAALVAAAGRGGRLGGVSAVARDHAKQVNIGGGNSGSISF